jgi:hypothetical protein
MMSRILIAEDDEVSCQLFAEVLETEGYQVTRFQAETKHSRDYSVKPTIFSSLTCECQECRCSRICPALSAT